jgi:hypothetical protein
MVRSIAVVTALAALGAGAFAEVDFTPRDSFYLAEATRIPNVAFRNGAVDVSYSPPGGWTLSGGGRKVTLTPPGKVQAGATIQTDPLKDPLPAKEENLKAYSDLALNFIPREASKINVVDAGIAPLKMSRRSMVEVTVAYTHFGQQFTTNILFLPYDKEQITFQVTARNQDFAALAKAFRASLFSMQGL